MQFQLQVVQVEFTGGISDFTTCNNQSDCSISFNYSINKIKKPQVKCISHYFGAQEKLNKYL